MWVNAHVNWVLVEREVNVVTTRITPCCIGLERSDGRARIRRIQLEFAAQPVRASSDATEPAPERGFDVLAIDGLESAELVGDWSP
jgi:hypothetical protein